MEIGGKRDDHAAQFLKRIAPHLQKLAAKATVIHGQLQCLIDDPYGD